MIALLGTSCASNRSVSRVQEFQSSSVQESRTDTVKEELMVAVHDTIRETTTITVQQNEAGDTVKLVKIADRTRASDRATMKEKEERVVVKTDTVFVERKVSVDVRNHSPTTGVGSSGGFVASLRWIFWIIVALGALIILIKVSKIF